MNLLRKGKFARNVLFMQRKSFISTNTELCTKHDLLTPHSFRLRCKIVPEAPADCLVMSYSQLEDN